MLILVLYILTGKRDRIRGKPIGTSLAIAAAIPVALISPPAWVPTTAATIAFVVALTKPRPTGSCTASTHSRSCVVGLAIVHTLGTWLSKRDPQPELAPAA